MFGHTRLDKQVKVSFPSMFLFLCSYVFFGLAVAV